MKPTITGLVLTFNGQRLLEPCLKSLDFCDEVLVVDSCSTDRTRELAEAAGARVILRPWQGPGPQFQFGVDQCPGQWVVSLDQDEILSAELRAAIQKAVQEAPEDLAGFYVPRRSFYFDRFLRHSGWYPDYLLRVFRPRRLRISVSGAHQHFHPQGPTARLAGDIVHYPYANFREHLAKMNSYAQQGADELRAKGRRGGLSQALAHGLGRFLKIYVLKLGVLDGRAGFINACAASYYAFQKYVRVAETGDWGPRD